MSEAMNRKALKILRLIAEVAVAVAVALGISLLSIIPFP